MQKHSLIAVAVAFLAAACTMEPKYDRPAAPVSGTFPTGGIYATQPGPADGGARSANACEASYSLGGVSPLATKPSCSVPGAAAVAKNAMNAMNVKNAARKTKAVTALASRLSQAELDGLLAGNAARCYGLRLQD